MSIVYKIQELCVFNGITIAELEKRLGYSNGSIKKSSTQTIRSDRVVEIANFFDVTPSYLLSNSTHNVCPVCAFNYDPLDENDISFHHQIHENFIKLRNKMGYLMDISQAASKKQFAKMKLKDEHTPHAEMIYSYETLLHCDFAEYAFENNYEIEIQYSDFIRNEIMKRKYFDLIPSHIIQNITLKYDINFDENNKPLIELIQDDNEFMANVTDFWELPQEFRADVCKAIKHAKRDYAEIKG